MIVERHQTKNINCVAQILLSLAFLNNDLGKTTWDCRFNKPM